MMRFLSFAEIYFQVDCKHRAQGLQEKSSMIDDHKNTFVNKK